MSITGQSVLEPCAHGTTAGEYCEECDIEAHDFDAKLEADERAHYARLDGEAREREEFTEGFCGGGDDQ
jgi:hypothetical protein